MESRDSEARKEQVQSRKGQDKLPSASGKKHIGTQRQMQEQT